MMGGGASLRQGGGGRRIPHPDGREKIPGAPRPPEILAPDGRKWLPCEPRWFARRQPLCVCVCVRACACLRVCVYVCAVLRVSLFCGCRNFRPAPNVFFRFSLILRLPRSVLGVLQPGLRAGPRRDLIGAKETRRASPGEALAV